jgi:FkbM family methyltransferase
MLSDSKISNFKSSINKLKQLDFCPDVIFDVGSYEGYSVQEFYKVWPNSRIVSFEVIPEKVELLLNKFSHNNFALINKLISSSVDNDVELFLDENASSLHNSNDCKVKPKINLEQTTIDAVINEIKCVPNLLHIDTVTNEFDILLGAISNLKRIDVVVLQVNVLDIYNVRIAIPEIFTLLKDNGLVLFDILEIHRRPKDNILWNLDLIFVQENSKWRTDKSW